MGIPLSSIINFVISYSSNVTTFFEFTFIPLIIQSPFKKKEKSVNVSCIIVIIAFAFSH